MSINGGCAPSELAQTDLRMTALKLILSKEGTVTPYGVVYDNVFSPEESDLWKMRENADSRRDF